MSTWTFWESIRWDVPAVVLAVMLIGFGWSLWATQRRPDFDFADIYRDPNGKPSLTRVTALGAWVASTWYLMQDMLDGVPTEHLFFAYLAVWSGAKVIEKAIEKWNGGVTGKQ